MARNHGDVAGATNGVAVVPGAGLIPETSALWVGAAGDVTVAFADAPAATVTLAGVLAGTLLPVRVVKVTVAAGGSVVALY